MSARFGRGSVQRVALPVWGTCARDASGGSRARLGGARRRTPRGSERYRRAISATSQPARIGRRMARVRSVSESQSRRGRNSQLRRGGSAGARRQVWAGLDALSAVIREDRGNGNTQRNEGNEGEQSSTLGSTGVAKRRAQPDRIVDTNTFD